MSNRIDNRLLTAIGACAIAAVLFGSTLARAMSADAVETKPVVPKPHTDPAQKAASETISMQAVNEAVAVDPFSPDRTPPATPYRLPTDPQEAPPPPPPPAPPPMPGFRLVGTAQTPTGGIALIQVDNGTPKVVKVGEAMNGYTVEKIDRVSATMVQGDRRMDLQLQQPQMRAQDVNNGRRPNQLPGVGPNGRVNGPGGGGGGRAGQTVQDMAVQQKMMMQEMQDLLQKRTNQTVVDVPVRQCCETPSLRNPRSDR